MKLIVNVDKNWGIGYQGSLLKHIREDMKFFRETTTGNVVVMGRKTLESFPGGLPLKNRVNIVITGNKDFTAEGAVIVHSVEEALTESQKYDSDSIYVIGGETIYRQMLPYCDTAHVTKMDAAFTADTWLPNLDEDPQWQLADASETKVHEDIEFRFLTYVRKQEN